MSLADPTGVENTSQDWALAVQTMVVRHRITHNAFAMPFATCKHQSEIVTSNLHVSCKTSGDQKQLV
jgi:hypothetical protein